MGYLEFVGRRLLRMVLSLVVISALTFTLLQLAPGSFADIQRANSGSTGMAGAAAQEVAGQFATRYGDDVPAWQQYLVFMKGALTWDLGPSYKYPAQSVESIIAQGFPVSATLAILATLLALAIAIPIGVFAALKQRTAWDTGSMFVLTLGHALPSYLTAVFLVLIFAGALHVLPAAGWSGPQSLILPVVALAIGPLAVLARYVRSSMLDTLSEEYVTAAIAKGGRPGVVIRKHVLRNSLIPLVTVTGPMLAALMTGTVFIETMFRIPGLGLSFTQAASSRDMPLLMGTTLFFAIILMATNLVVDLVYGLLDPRVRAESGRKLRGSRVSRKNAGDAGAGGGEGGRPVVQSLG
ncbi:binding-protein-dependent transport systems inner membrane component [Beutenbergia cavernae DSM 12333]|uniref:Binding-protein-dependent transport systems inner membrane component n=1 Tax=Beutenbergia cavernae (strain ATCC BAA-8 / DSM 12333 / CCUG 43141 / JCM 11478 / NBRC 16432 / NCIMB 13614 / HKI 0122) TaxID=471853 RepID=C5C1H4_BEUC1|nr:ABC transporter permease [Beutenbergia cavernae]ACQ81584.1 binding-protein-dependent transport systems inner membrane component [Beutenbergia cavernae DSM 12333]